MDILNPLRVFLSLMLLLLLTSPCISSSVDPLPATVSCRSSCLDKFCSGLPNEAQCQSVKDCKMCWEACHLLHSDFDTWGNMCTVQEICLPGCHQACITITSRKTTKTTNHSISIHSLYDPQTEQVSLGWKLHQENLKNKGVILYAVLLKDSNAHHDEKWNQLIQTTAHTVQVKRGLLNRDTYIRLVGANAFGQMTDVITSYLDSLTDERRKYLKVEYYQENRSSTHFTSSTLHWRPHLLSLNHTMKSVGVYAMVMWSPVSYLTDVKYEVSWNVIDDIIEISGHLHTVGNATVLTLWPNAMYTVQVTAIVDGEVKKQSEPLLINTHTDELSSNISPNRSCKRCPAEYELLIVCVTGLFILLLPSAMYFTFLRLRHLRQHWSEKAIEESSADIQHIDGKIPTVKNLNLQQSSNKILKIPCYFLNKPLGTHFDIENIISSRPSY